VGNLVLGGSGKTPAAAAVARLLCAAGERPAILSRGYARREPAEGVVVVSDGEQVLEPAARSGDEPQMLARQLPGVVVLVSTDRHLAGLLAERRFGSTVHILDDGFQHVRLERDVDLLLVAPEDLDERVVPMGRLREPLDSASVADAIITCGATEDVVAVSARLNAQRVFQLVRRYAEPRLVEPFGGELPAGARRALAVAGIARPKQFFAALRALGWDVIREIALRDHHWFTDRDLVNIENAARESGADVIMTTEKDAMRLLDVVGSRRAGPSGPSGGSERPTLRGFAYLPMTIDVEPQDQFAAWLHERLTQARQRRSLEAA
jgi:tetraacyldisaccharide 4'-kinase